MVAKCALVAAILMVLFIIAQARANEAMATCLIDHSRDTCVTIMLQG